MKAKTLITSFIVLLSTSVSSAELIINWKNPHHVHNKSTIEKVSNETGLKIKYLKPLQKSFDLIYVEMESKEALKILSDSDYFKFVETVDFSTNPVADTSILKPESIVKHNSNDVGTQSLIINKFNDPLYLNQEYFDDQEKTRMGLSSIGKARDYAIKNKAIDRKVRIAVLDTGKWPHQDINWSSVDEASFVSSGIYGCLTADPTNTGKDLTCSSANIYNDYPSNNALAKSWTDLDSDGTYEVRIPGHGLAVASQIAAIANNGVGFVGIVPENDVEIVPVRVLGADSGSTTDATNAIFWAVGSYSNGNLQPTDKGYVRPISKPVDIINLSLGGVANFSCEANSYLKEAIDEAYRKDVMVLIAAGNESTNTRYVNPANCEKALTISSNKKSGEISNFSNFGDFSDVSMIGEQIIVASVNEVYYGASNNTCGSSDDVSDCYSTSSGTSMSTPNVAGALALLKIVHPTFSAKELEAMLLNTAVPFVLTTQGNVSRAAQVGYGAGVVNAYNALLNDPLIIDKINIKHHYAGTDSVFQETHIKQILKIVPTACSFFDVDFGSFNHEASGVSYNLYRTNSTGDLSLETPLPLTVPKVMIDRSVYSRAAVQSCKNGVCGSLVELDFSQTQKPTICKV
uniref:S8 family serine peptidase n=1 Tax=Shewanella baltica TaxID=62322 RepID=UPI004047379A